MLKNNNINSWNYSVNNFVYGNANVGEVLSGAGGSGTPHVYASYVASSLVPAYDCFFMRIFALINISYPPWYMTLGIDPTGGTSYTDIIPDLLMCGSGTASVGTYYSFPIYIPAGSSIAVKGVLGGTITATPNIYLGLQLFGQPSRPDLISYGYKVEGINTYTGSFTSTRPSSTLVTPGTGTEGTWTSIGTTSNRCIYWQVGQTHNSTTNKFIVTDIASGNGTNYSILKKASILTSSTCGKVECGVPPWKDVPAGSTIYARSKSSATETTLGVCAYGVIA